MNRGEEPAIEQFYRRFFDRLYGLARKASHRDESFCLDVVQDAMLRIVRTIRPIETEAQLLAWLKLVIQSVCYDALRREQRRQAREAAAARAASPPDPAAAEHLADLRRALLTQDPALVRMIELRYLHGWTLARVARLFDLRTGAVDGRIRRALARIRQHAAEVCND